MEHTHTSFTGSKGAQAIKSPHPSELTSRDRRGSDHYSSIRPYR